MQDHGVFGAAGAFASDGPGVGGRVGADGVEAAYEVVEYHEWQRWVDGSPLLRVGESGEIRFDEGAPISAKGNLLRAADLDGDWGVFDLADEDTVMAVAAE